METSIKGRIYALNGADGTLKWTYENSTASYYYNIRTSCAVYKEDGTNKNIIIFGDDNGRLYKIRDDDTFATELWVISLSSGNPIISSPIINSTRNKIFVGCNDGFVYGVNANGSALSNWPVSIGEPVQSTPGIYGVQMIIYILEQILEKCIKLLQPQVQLHQSILQVQEQKKLNRQCLFIIMAVLLIYIME